jgi:hypothetical protein
VVNQTGGASPHNKREKKMTKRTININGLKLGFNNAVFLLDLVNSTHEKLKKEDKNSMSCISIKKQLSEYLAQWENIQLGDIVKYRGDQS